VLVRGKEILGYGSAATGFDAVNAAQEALTRALEAAKVSRDDVAGIVSTGIFRDVVKALPIAVQRTVPEYMADAKGALFLNKNSRTVIDIGANVHKAVHYDKDGKSPPTSFKTISALMVSAFSTRPWPRRSG